MKLGIISIYFVFLCIYISAQGVNTNVVVKKPEPGKAVNQRSQIRLNVACAKGDLEAVKAEIKKGAWVETRDFDGQTPLFHAVKSNNINLVKYLVDSCGAKINVVDLSNITMLHIAAKVGSKSIVSFLIEKGLDVNAKAATPSYKLNKAQSDRKALDYFPEWSKTGKSPLHFAAEGGSEEVVRLLLEAGADLDYVTNGDSPLDLASQYPEVVSLLKSSSARSSRELRFNREIFEPVIAVLDENYSKQSPHAEVFEKIKTNLKSIDYSKYPVFYYVSKNSWNVIENVVDAEGDRARKAVNGITPLLFTILKGNKRIAEILISNGSDPAYLIHKDYSLLQLAQALKNNEITELLASSLKNPAQKKQDE
jgi:ankyrin repeat protein